jgi:hypothetical protein
MEMRNGEMVITYRLVSWEVGYPWDVRLTTVLKVLGSGLASEVFWD